LTTGGRKEAKIAEVDTTERVGRSVLIKVFRESMFCPLMMDPRIGWIQPEQKGPAFETWSGILEDVTSPSTNLENLLGGRPDFIPLNRKSTFNDAAGTTALNNMINSGKNHVSKKKRFENRTPWWSKDKNYPDGLVG